MSRISTRSNPTNLKSIDHHRLGITLSTQDGKRCFSVHKLELDGLDLDGRLNVICVARAGNTSQRFSLGTVSAWSNDIHLLEDIDFSAPLRFRILVHDEAPKLVASAERVRLFDEGQADSLLPMEPADLGEEVWRLLIGEDGPILQYNPNVFRTAVGMENYVPFRALVLPEALRQVMSFIASEPTRLEDENDPISAWLPWLHAHGFDAPESDDSKQEWPNQVVTAFCHRHRFADNLYQHLRGDSE